jgi:hypothetical protein
MARYTVLNTKTKILTHHRRWGSAMIAADRHPPEEVIITEIDRKGRRQYNHDGRTLRDSGHVDDL